MKNHNVEAFKFFTFRSSFFIEKSRLPDSPDYLPDLPRGPCAARAIVAKLAKTVAQPRREGYPLPQLLVCRTGRKVGQVRLGKLGAPVGADDEGCLHDCPCQ